MASSTLLVSGCVVGRTPRPEDDPAIGGIQIARPAPEASAVVGLASWYGRFHHGRPTASGEIFDMTRLTAAHRTLPIGTRLRVTNLENGRIVRVRVNDRGPYVDGRVVDLSHGAAQALDMVERGLVPVRLDILETP